MLKYIEFKNDLFDQDPNHNLFGGNPGLTKNTIVLCDAYETMNFMHDMIVKIVNEKTFENDESMYYDYDDADEGHAETKLCFGLQRVIKIGKQTVTLALEPSIIYKAETLNDIWFMEHAANYRIYPMTDFKGSVEKWVEGKDEVYKFIVSGRYGCYTGDWTNLGSNGVQFKNGQLTGHESLKKSI